MNPPSDARTTDTPTADPSIDTSTVDTTITDTSTTDAGTEGDIGGVDRMVLLSVLSGSWLAQAGYAMAKLGVADLLDDGPRTADDLAAACGAHPEALHRMLRALAAVGLFEEPGPRTFGLTDASALLRSDAARSARLGAIMYGEEVFRSFAEIMHTARTGRPAFDKAYGMGFYEYLDADAEASRRFNAAMGGLRETPAVLAASHCLDGVRTLVDVGGGTGNLLADTLRAHPGMRGVLLELPEAVRQARGRLAGAGPGVLDRVELVEGSFFDQVPSGGDLYVLARCLHNWSDDEAVRILRTVRAAMEPGGRLVILEKLIPEGHGFSPAKLVDLLMLVMVTGRDRTEAEYRDLLDRSGFEMVASHPAPVPDPRAESAIEAAAA
ncbi:methyltransferase [Actinomadura spongiicola]|uniref:methyltransferase n=1 Tax=Actinomadura spongiicola TaxID=2303421 RepID=UPI0011C1A3F0|nr:methyltransferase [Actinomadura spongiicola]